MLRDTLCTLRTLFIHFNSLDPSVVFSIVAKGVTSQAHIQPDLRDGSRLLMSAMTPVPGKATELKQSMMSSFYRSPELCQLRLRYVIAILIKVCVSELRVIYGVDFLWLGLSTYFGDTRGFVVLPASSHRQCCH